MGILLKVVGIIWALIGLGNLIGMPWMEGSETVLGFGIIFNMLLFIIPGLVVYGIGSRIDKKKVTSTEVMPSNNDPRKLSVEDRLSKLNQLKEKDIINETEFEKRRAEILKEI